MQMCKLVGNCTFNLYTYKLIHICFILYIYIHNYTHIRVLRIALRCAKQKIDNVKSCTCSRQEVVIVQQMFRIEDLENLILSHHCLPWTYPVREGGRERG